MKTEPPLLPRLDRVKVTLLSLGHLVVDLYPPFLAALLPLLIERLELSITLAGLLASILMVSSSLSQPIFGILADRIGGRHFLLVGPVMAATGMSVMALLPSYALVLFFLIIGGLGTACYHPQAAALAGRFSGPKKGLGVALFMVGGNLGYGMGPLVILAIVLGLGMEKSYVAVLPAIFFVFTLRRFLPKKVIPPPAARVERGTLKAFHSGNVRRFALLWVVVWLRSSVGLGLSTFLPTLQTMRGLSLAAGGGSFTVFMMGAALGGLVGGTLSDRAGRKRVVILSFCMVIPAFYGFLHTPVKWTFLFLPLVGFSLFLGESPCIVMAQETAPERGGTMSALIMGFAWGMAGLTLVGVGALADTLGMRQAIGFLLYLPVVALVLAFFLPGIALRGKEMGTTV